MTWKSTAPGFMAGLVIIFGIQGSSTITLAQGETDSVTKFPRDPVHISAWPGGKKVAVSFALFVEVFAFGQGPVFRPDLMTRNPDLSNDILPLGRGLAEQKDYVRRTLDLIASTTGVRPTGWSSPSVYSNGDTMQATAAEGITYSLDQMDSSPIGRIQVGH
jgi:hypothetical protein